jgi:hypothetical protein
MATLTIPASTDCRITHLSDIAQIVFATPGSKPAVARFNGAQFGPQISHTVRITADASANSIHVSVDHSFSAAGWSFVTWDANDAVILEAGAGADTIIGSTRRDVITGGEGTDTITSGAGADQLDGGAGDDVFVYRASEDLSGESIAGGDGIDAIRLETSGTTSFRPDTVGGVERLEFAAAAGSQVAEFSAANRIVVDGTSVDLSRHVFGGWTAGVDSIAIDGTGANDTLAGSGQGDVIAGGRGADGGSDADTFVWLSMDETGIDGATHDILAHFNPRKATGSISAHRCQYRSGRRSGRHFCRGGRDHRRPDSGRDRQRLQVSRLQDRQRRRP